MRRMIEGPFLPARYLYSAGTVGEWSQVAKEAEPLQGSNSIAHLRKRGQTGSLIGEFAPS
jgi:hypothetical protein